MKKENLRLIALIPHRDVMKTIDEYRGKLFENGFFGAYSFPGIIPLMITRRPYTLAALKETAVSLRNMISEKSTSGKFVSKNAGIVEVFPGITLGGISFNFSLDGTVLQEGDVPLPRFLLGLALVKQGTEEKFLRFAENAPLLSFRSAAVANVIYRMGEHNDYSWEIGHPVWLPSTPKGKKHG